MLLHLSGAMTIPPQLRQGGIYIYMASMGLLTYGPSNFGVFYPLSEGLWLENFAVRKARASPKINSFLLWGRMVVVVGGWLVGGLGF